VCLDVEVANYEQLLLESMIAFWRRNWQQAGRAARPATA